MPKGVRCSDGNVWRSGTPSMNLRAGCQDSCMLTFRQEAWSSRGTPLGDLAASQSLSFLPFEGSLKPRAFQPTTKKRPEPGQMTVQPTEPVGQMEGKGCMVVAGRLSGTRQQHLFKRAGLPLSQVPPLSRRPHEARLKPGKAVFCHPNLGEAFSLETLWVFPPTARTVAPVRKE